MDKQQLLERIAGIDAAVAVEEKADCAAIKVPAGRLLDISSRLRDEADLGFDLLLSHTAVHWPERGEFELLYHLYSTSHRHHLLLLTVVPVENAVIASVQGLWRIAEWQEREVYDLFGVLYSGHPDLRRLFLEDDWQGHPLRKDYKDDFMLEGS